MKKLVCILPLLFLSLAGCETSRQDVVEHLQNISVSIDVTNGEGSGTIFNDKDQSYVLTAAHVVMAAKKDDGKFELITIHQFDIHNNETVKESSYKAEILKISEKNDMALLLIKRNRSFPDEGKVYDLPEYPPQGTRLYHVGCLFGKDGYNSFTTGVVSQYGREVLGHTLVQTTCTIYPGSSGGGIFLTDGKYIGMVLAGKSPGVSYYTPVQDIKKWLKEVGYDHILN